MIRQRVDKTEMDSKGCNIQAEQMSDTLFFQELVFGRKRCKWEMKKRKKINGEQTRRATEQGNTNQILLPKSPRSHLFKISNTNTLHII